MPFPLEVLEKKILVCHISESVAIRIGPNYRQECAPLHLCNSPLVYVDQVKYLGILLLAACGFKCSFDRLKMKFNHCFNAIYHKSCNANSELVCVELMKSVCLPVLFGSFISIENCS